MVKKKVVKKKVDENARYIVKTKVIDTVRGTTTFKVERVATI